MNNKNDITRHNVTKNFKIGIKTKILVCFQMYTISPIMPLLRTPSVSDDDAKLCLWTLKNPKPNKKDVISCERIKNHN